jgi:hypothetical protein
MLSGCRHLRNSGAATLFSEIEGIAARTPRGDEANP